jgi:hypothetical protein
MPGDGLLEESQLEVIKIGHGVCLGPQPDPAVGESAVTQAKKRGAVVLGSDVATLLNDSQLVPPSGRKRVIDLFDDLLHAFYHTIQPNLLFDQAGPQ